MHKVFILGESGSGKTSSLRSLDPKTTAIINSDKKAMPLEGWRKNYLWAKTPDGKTDLDKSNYVELDVPSHVLATLKKWAARADIKTIVVDTITHIITSNYMKDTIGKDFKAYQHLGLNAYHIFDFIRSVPNKNIIIFGHIDEKFNDMGQRVVQMKSYGKSYCHYPLNSGKAKSEKICQSRAKRRQSQNNSLRTCNDYPLCSGVGNYMTNNFRNRGES